MGVVMIRVIAGEDGYRNYDPHRPSEEFIERVRENWAKRLQETVPSHSSEQVKRCTEIALRCVEFNREKRPTITDIVDELNEIDAPESSAIGGGQNSAKKGANIDNSEKTIRDSRTKGK